MHSGNIKMAAGAESGLFNPNVVTIGIKQAKSFVTKRGDGGMFGPRWGPDALCMYRAY